eukprot:6491483-Amphidinium_carterae.1
MPLSVCPIECGRLPWHYLLTFSTTWMSSTTRFVAFVDGASQSVFILFQPVLLSVQDGNLLDADVNMRGGGKRPQSGHQNATPGGQRITLSYHGTFGPFHPGHAEVIRCAHETLTMQGFIVDKTVVGFTTPEHAARKLRSTFWTPLAFRAAIAKAVIADIGLPGVIVDATGHKTSAKLAEAHSARAAPAIYLAGTDTIARPSDCTLCVIRNGSERTRSYFDHQTWSGVCRQQFCRGLSSTLVREWMVKGSLPSLYGAQARAELQKTRTQPLVISQFKPTAANATPAIPKPGSYSGSSSSSTAQASKPHEQCQSQVRQWSPSEQHATYGLGFDILSKMGFDPHTPQRVPLVGVVRRRHAGLQDDETAVIDTHAMRLVNNPPVRPAITLMPAAGLKTQQTRDTPALPKAMPARRVLPAAQQQMGPPPLPVRPVVHQVIDVEADRAQVVEIAQSVASDSSDSESSGGSSISSNTRLIMTESRDDFRLRHLTLCMKWAKQGLYRDLIYLSRCPWLQETIQSLAMAATSNLGEVHFNELVTALSLMPWKALTISWSDPVYGRLMTSRVRAELEAFHRADQLTAGVLPVTRWIFHLLQDLTVDVGSDFDIVSDWIFAESLSLAIMSEVFAVDELHTLVRVGPPRPTIRALDLAKLIDGLLLQLQPTFLAEDQKHLRGCRCNERVFSQQVRIPIPADDEWSVPDLLRSIVPILASLWNLKAPTLSTSRGACVLCGCCTREPVCLVPIHFVSNAVFQAVARALAATHHEVLVLEPTEVPVDTSELTLPKSMAQLRRRALTFPFVIGILVVPDGSCAYVARSPESMPNVTRRYPGILTMDGYENLTFPSATQDEAVGLLPPLNGGFVEMRTVPTIDFRTAHSGCPSVQRAPPATYFEFIGVLLIVLGYKVFVDDNNTALHACERGGMRKFSLADPGPQHVLDTCRKRRRRVIMYQLGSHSPPQIIFVSHDLDFASLLDLLAQHLAAHKSWLRVTRTSGRGWTVVVEFVSPTPPNTDWSRLLNSARQTLAGRDQLFLGYRATRQHGMSVATECHYETVLLLNQWGGCWLPSDFEWNAIAIVDHKCVPLHVDKFNSDQSIAISLTTCRSLLDYFSTLTQSQQCTNMVRRPALFNPRHSHGAQTRASVVSVIFYHTSRAAKIEHVARLHQLGFRNHSTAIMPAQIADSSPEPCREQADTDQDSQPAGEHQPESRSTTVDYDTDDLVPLTQLLPNRTTHAVHPPTISPTLSFHEDHRGGSAISKPVSRCRTERPCRLLTWLVCTGCLFFGLGTAMMSLRGGSPNKPKVAQRLTWEGTSGGPMLDIQTKLLDSTGKALPQIHASLVCADAQGFALVNWASWQEVSSVRSSGSLLAILPGHRAFELAKPEDSCISRVDMVVGDPTSNKRFPRLVTAVQLGAKPARIEGQCQEDVTPVVSATPVEILLEVDNRCWEGTDARADLRLFINEALQSTGAAAKMYAVRVIDDGGPLVFAAKLRVSVTHANQLLARSGQNGVFAKPAQHCVSLVTKMALVWLTEEQMAARPAQVLRNALASHSTAGGLCRSAKVFGVRVEPRIAGTLRATLGVQAAHQFSWNESLVPSLHFVLRGAPPALTDTEVTTALHQALSWAQVPIRRLKTSQQAGANWLIGADSEPTQTHTRIGTSLVTIEPADTTATKSSGRAKTHSTKTKSQKSRPSDASSWRSDAAWDPWSASWQANKENRRWQPSSYSSAAPSQSSSSDAWHRYQPPQQAAPQTSAVQPDVAALQSRVDRMEQATAKNTDELQAVAGRVQTVEASVTSLGSQMQLNFDRLFSAFESRNSPDAAARKAPRLDEHRGGAPMTLQSKGRHASSRSLANKLFLAVLALSQVDVACGHQPRGGASPLMSEIDLACLEEEPDSLRVLFCNTTSHKRHLDHLLDINVGADVVIIGESNHTKGVTKPTRNVPMQNGGSLTLNMEWTPPVRFDGDHHVKGRASAGVMMASPHALPPHPLETPKLADLAKQGRCLVRRVQLQPFLWINLFGVYAPVNQWSTTSDENYQFIADLVTEVMAAPDELSMIVGDFNTEFAADPVSQALHASMALLDLGEVCSVPGFPQPHTYRTSSSSSAIDRAMISPALLRWVSAFHICTAAGTGSHLPIAVTFKLPPCKPPPLLRQVLEIPISEEPASPDCCSLATCEHHQVQSLHG